MSDDKSTQSQPGEGRARLDDSGTEILERADAWVDFDEEIAAELGGSEDGALPEEITLGTEGYGLGLVTYLYTGPSVSGPGKYTYRRSDVPGPADILPAVAPGYEG